MTLASRSRVFVELVQNGMFVTWHALGVKHTTPTMVPPQNRIGTFQERVTKGIRM